MKDFFAERLTRFQNSAKQYATQSNQLANLRLGLFVVSISVVFALYKVDYFVLVLLLIPLVAALYTSLVIRHNKTNYAKQKAILSARVNQQELDRLNGVFNNLELYDGFKNHLHPYAKDLDIVGVNSVFSLVSRCAGISGKVRMANVLTEGRSREDVLQCQQASVELENEIDYRQEFQVLGLLHPFSLQQKNDFDSWLHSSGKHVSIWFLYLLNVLSAGTILLVLWGYNWTWLFVPVVLNLLFLSTFKKNISSVVLKATDFSGLLNDLCKQLELIENRKFQSLKLQNLQQSCLGSKTRSSAFVKSMAYKFSMLEYARNPYFYVLANFTFLWDLHWYKAIEKDRNELSLHFDKWLNALAEFEVLASFAATRFANSDWVFPEISDEIFLYKAEQISHPLIIAHSRVSNSVSMQDTGKTWVLTGSNMAGKSTFLRTLAVNAVMAMAGGPVCAKACTLSMMKVFSSMRTEDNLQESTSSFYAELKRLKLLLDFINEGLPVFYVLDEILKGTNSRDRQAGSYAFIKKLLTTHSSGIIATHDVELGQLADEFPGKVSNYHFSSDVVDSKLYFDYQLKQGICQSFNATQLMKNIGIEVEESDYK